MSQQLPPLPPSPGATNPANVPEAERAAAPLVRKRIPMSTPQRRLEVPSIPGYVCYWFKESNVLRAQAAGYEFVTRDEVPINQMSVANDKGISGNQDLGSHIRIQASLSSGGDAGYAMLMKIKQEWYNEDQRAIAERNASIMQAVFAKEQILGSDDVPQGKERDVRYVKTATLLNRNSRKAVTQG